MKKKLTILFLLIISFIQCNSQNNTKLTIEGNNIWIREYPTTGDVIMKLNEGDVCNVLKKDKEETIRGITDYWYKIKFENKIGWVFGSQTSIKQNKKLIKPFKDFNIKYEEGLDIKIINRVLVEEDEFESKILFEYTYSDKKPPLTFVNVFVVGEPWGIYILNKSMDFNELKEKVSNLDLSIFSSEELDPTNIELTREGILADVSYYTTMHTTVIYKKDNGFIRKTKQNEYFINKKTTSLENFNFYKSKDLKKIKGTISKNESITIISTIEDNFSTGGIFKIKSKKGEIGWINMKLIPGFGNENKPQLKEIKTSVW